MPGAPREGLAASQAAATRTRLANEERQRQLATGGKVRDAGIAQATAYVNTAAGKQEVLNRTAYLGGRSQTRAGTTYDPTLMAKARHDIISERTNAYYNAHDPNDATKPKRQSSAPARHKAHSPTKATPTADVQEKVYTQPVAQEDIGVQKLVDINRGAGVSSFSISNFRSNAVNQDSILPKHSFLVTFAPFAESQGASKFLNKYIRGVAGANLIMRCDSAQLPGVTALKDEVRRFGYGPVEDSVYGMQFQDMTLGFILDQDATQAKFFDEWMHLVTNFTSKGGGAMMQTNDKGMMPYEVGYKDDYSNLQMNITVFDRAERQVMVYEIYDIFPTSINAVDVSWGDTDQMLRYYVRFAYTDYSVRIPNVEYALYEASGDNGKVVKSPDEETIVVTARPTQGATSDLGGITAFGTSFGADPGKTYISLDPTNKTSVVDNYLPKDSLLRTPNLDNALKRFQI